MIVFPLSHTYQIVYADCSEACWVMIIPDVQLPLLRNPRGGGGVEGEQGGREDSQTSDGLILASREAGNFKHLGNHCEENVSTINVYHKLLMTPSGKEKEKVTGW